MVGGLFRGRARGNTFKMGDAGMYYFFLTTFILTSYSDDVDMMDDEVVEKGKVLLYTSREKASEPMSTNMDSTKSLPKVLQNLSLLYSPIRSMFLYSLWF
jgi:hypothetical protein